MFATTVFLNMYSIFVTKQTQAFKRFVCWHKIVNIIKDAPLKQI